MYVYCLVLLPHLVGDDLNEYFLVKPNLAHILGLIVIIGFTISLPALRHYPVTYI